MGTDWNSATFAAAPLTIIDGDRGTNYPQQSDFSKGGYCLFLNAGNVTKCGFEFADCAFVSKSKDDALRKGKLERDDVVLTTRGTVGNVAYFDAAVPFDNVRINSGMVILRADPSRLLPRFLYLYVRSGDFMAQVASLQTGSAQPQLPIRDINRIELPLPPLPEQRAIAGVLGALDDKIEVNRKTARVLEGIARAVFTSWFVDFDPVRRHPHAVASSKAPAAPTAPTLPRPLAALFPTRLVDSVMGEVPEGWRASTLGEVIEIHDSKRIPLSSQQRAARPGPFRYYGAAGIVDHVDAYLFDGTYLLLGEDGSVVDGAGRPVVQYVWGQFWVNNHAHVLTGTRGFSIEHLYLLAQGLNVKPFVTGAVQPKISQGNLKAIPIVLAPEPVNIAFGEIVAPLFARVKIAHDQSAILAALRDALLPKLISGELRIADAEKIVGRAV
jgi:type I restriction enzyme S subunit